MGLKILIGDIVDQDTDAIVNAANPSLLGGGGVDGAIHAAAGPGLVGECASFPLNGLTKAGGLGRCDVGEAKITAGYNLKARRVIHTVGPVWGNGDPDGYKEFLLASSYRSCFRLLKASHLHSISFPSISTGAYGFPVDRASKVALNEINTFLRENPNDEVRVVCFDVKTYKCYQEALTLLIEKEKVIKYNVETN